MFSELKQIRTTSLKSWIIASCLRNRKKFCKALVDAPIGFLVTQNELKMMKIGVGTREGSRAV